jgi:hypothetical protein
MKKEEIYVEITNEQERLRVIEILQNAGEEIMNYNSSDFKLCYDYKYLSLTSKGWWLDCYTDQKTKINLDELETLLNLKKSNVELGLLECLKQVQQHLINDYPQGTEIKISKDKIEIYHS